MDGSRSDEWRIVSSNGRLYLVAAQTGVVASIARSVNDLKPYE